MPRRSCLLRGDARAKIDMQQQAFFTVLVKQSLKAEDATTDTGVRWLELFLQVASLVAIARTIVFWNKMQLVPVGGGP
eukprot:5157826-Amphidinium_carterae.1